MNEWTLRAAEARKDGFDGKVEVRDSEKWMDSRNI